MKTLYKAFPPGWNNIQVPTHNKGATLAGIATYTPCMAKGLWGQRAAWALVRAGGARLLPGRSATWDPPFVEEHWAELNTQLHQIVGNFDSHTVYERRRGRRGLLMLLLSGDRPVAFVKAREGDAPEIIREEEAMAALEKSGTESFYVPKVMGSGEVGGWRYLVSTPMPAKMHRMLKAAPPQAILDEVVATMSALRQPDSMPAGWQPFHGDFTPWNLRQIGTTKPWLIDWETAGWAPPDADRVLYIASAYALGHPVTSEPLVTSEAVRYWWKEINIRVQEKLDSGLELRQLDYGLLESLAPGRDA